MKKNELRIINTILAIGHARIPSREAVAKIVSSLTRLTEADRSALYFSDYESEGLLLAAESKPEVKLPSPERFTSDSKLSEIAGRLDSAYIFDGPAAIDPLWDEYAETVIIPFRYNLRKGIQLILSHKLDKLKALSRSFLNILGETLSLVMEDLAMSEAIKIKLDELNLLNEIGRSCYSMNELDKLVPLLTRRMTEAFGCESGHIMLRLREEEGEKVLRYSFTTRETERSRQKYLDGTHDRIMSGDALEMDVACQDEMGDPDRGTPLYLSGFPLTWKQEKIGSAILLHYNRLGRHNTFLLEDDKGSFMEAMSTLVSMAVGNTLNYTEASRLAVENENRASELSILFEISQVLAGTMRLDDVLKIILTAATFGHGLGFNRAALFLLNEKTNTLQGMMGVGPENSQEAQKIWAELSSKNWALSEALKMSLKSPISNTLHTAIKTIRIPVSPESGILARAVLEKKAFNIADSGTYPGVNPDLIEKTGTKAFAAAPMIAEDKVLGVLAVDNLYNGRPITSKDLQLLSTFANQAALALNNAQLYNRLGKTNTELKNMYRRLSQSERLATLGEMAATVAHEVRNPLVSVGGFARRLEKRLNKNDPNRRYTRIIMKEITRLEKFLNEILIFSRELPITLMEVNFNNLIGEMADFFHEELDDKGIKLELNLSDNLPSFEADPELLSQILMNLFSNSIDALDRDGKITVQTIPPDNNGYVSFAFSDNGGGVSEELLSNIFSPFFTTKTKGTGLGLPLVHKMVKHHQGNIEVLNKPGESITFIVKLPIKPDTGNSSTQ